MIAARGNWAEFHFYRPGARRVWLVGDLDDRRIGCLAMQRDVKGYWTAAIRLPRETTASDTAPTGSGSAIAPPSALNRARTARTP